MSQKVVLLGNGTMAARALPLLRGLPGVEVPLVLADPSDDGVSTWRESLVAAARGLGYVDGTTLLLPANPNAADVCAAVAAVGADLVISVQCKRIIRDPLIKVPRRGVVNVHNSPLPLLRGCDPFAWAIHDGLRVHGVSLHDVPDAGVDNGAVYAQKLWEIGPDATAWDLYQRGLDEAMALIQRALPGVLSGETKTVPQELRFVTYHSMHQFHFGTPPEWKIDWELVAATLDTFIRSRIFPPFQLPWTVIRGQRVEVLRARVIPGATTKPGIVTLIGGPLHGLGIGAKWGGILLQQLRVDGREVTGEEYATSRGLALGVDTRVDGADGAAAAAK